MPAGNEIPYLELEWHLENCKQDTKLWWWYFDSISGSLSNQTINEPEIESKYHYITTMSCSLNSSYLASDSEYVVSYAIYALVQLRHTSPSPLGTRFITLYHIIFPNGPIRNILKQNSFNKNTHWVVKVRVRIRFSIKIKMKWRIVGN